MPSDAMSHHLGRAARALREQHGVTQLDIAIRANVSEPTIHRFEQGAGTWRHRTDEIVAAYAYELGTSPQEIWLAAIDSWRRSPSTS